MWRVTARWGVSGKGDGLRRGDAPLSMGDAPRGIGDALRGRSGVPARARANCPSSSISHCIFSISSADWFFPASKEALLTDEKERAWYWADGPGAEPISRL